MRSEIYDRPELKLECLRRIVGLKLDEVRTFLLANIVETYLELSEEEQIRYDRHLEDNADAEEVRTMQMTWADKMIAKGREEGLSMGIARGRLDEARRILVEVLTVRFGPLPTIATTRLERLDDPEELRRLTRQAIGSASLAELGLGDKA